jgi:predicted small secreted protein
MKRILTLLGITVFSTTLVACNTMHGMGQDIQRGGEKLESSSSGASSGASSSSSRKTEQQKMDEQKKEGQ